MNLQRLLQDFQSCDCGKSHSCPIQEVWIEHGAIQKLTAFCASYQNILLVADENTFAAAGEAVERALANQKRNRVIFDGKTLLIPNEDAIARVQACLSGTDLIVGIGSGVIQDLCKYVSFFSKVPYVIVATAPSMDGYASTGAAMILGGMKETVAAGLPLAIIADTAVLKDAPMEMICAGYGDIIGKYSALCDWRLSLTVNGEYFCQAIYDTTYRMITETHAQAQGLLQRNEESIAALTEALVTVGIMMSFAGSSRPASGSEHHLSHFFEITGIVHGEEYFPHGVDVAYSTVITAKLREKILQRPFPNSHYRLTQDALQKKLSALYGKVAEGCLALQERVGNYAADRTALYLQKEQEIRAVLQEMPGAAEIEEMLKLVHLDMADFYALYGTEKIENAILYAKDLKDRYTVLWLYYDLFGGNEI